MKFAIAIGPDLQRTVELNAVGHVCIGLSLLLGRDHAALREFRDVNGLNLSLMTDFPLIVFKARRPEHIRDAHLAAIEQGVACNAFFECMRHSSAQDQETSLSRAPASEQTYLAAGFFGTPEQLKILTRQFSLYRDAQPS